MRLVMIDNYDSFTYNLVQLFFEFDLEVLVYRNDQISIDDVRRLEPDWICISPGPKDPKHAGISKALVEQLGPHVPILGVCLGMQVINEVFGGRTKKAPVPVHGKTSSVVHSGHGIFTGIPSPFRAARYHSLCIEPHDDCIVPLAFAEDGVIMGVQHAFLPICGVQFHPESFMSEFGLDLVQNFLARQHGWISQNRFRNEVDRFPRLGSGMKSTLCSVAV
jgi:anthranilate synthase component 2